MSNDKVRISGKFTAENLPIAVGHLFEINNYEVSYGVHVHGAEVDIVAIAKGDPFSRPVYIEATIEYVSTEKYGKDTTKFLLLQKKDPGCTLLCVSSSGFTPSVKERAIESGVGVLTYDELFKKFEKFSPYIDLVINNKEIRNLTETYEEPTFSDSKGTDIATKWLGYWRGYTPEGAKWLIILGEYGTGKTALTKVMQYRWLQEYHKDPAMAIPIRIELRNFNRQFDAKGLLHHFLDSNELGHVPVEFMMHLIRTGRVLLLLDGYDEMAQYLNARERRACLGALAELAADGAKGILTSRPNYFTEAEELDVFEALYKSLEQSQYHLSKIDQAFIAQERSVDELIERYVLNRYDRVLQDLTQGQTESLVRRSLSKDPKGQEIVLSILKRVFREEDGQRQPLSGKPIIIAYLLEIVDEIRNDSTELTVESFTEWQVYKLIVDRLMIRDLRRSTLNPLDRRKALQRLAAVISGRDVVVADEKIFYDIIEEIFQSELKRLSPDEKRTRRTELFEDLRSSATLTRAVGTRKDGWVFSHNSLREFLLTEMFLNSLKNRTPRTISTPISFAMRAFSASIGVNDLESLWQILTELWPQRTNHNELGPYVSLLWDAARKADGGARVVLGRISGGAKGARIDLSDTQLKDIDFSTDFSGAPVMFNFTGSVIADSNLSKIDLSGSRFDSTVLDAVVMRGSNLRSCYFQHSILFECDISGSDIFDADFQNLSIDSSILVELPDKSLASFSGESAIGYLRYHGAKTDDLDPIYVYQHHPKFPIVEKILEKISVQKNSQLRGLTQRGEARADPPFAREFVDRLVSLGWIEIDRNELVSVTPAGRPEISRIVAGGALSPLIADFLSDRR